MRRIRRSNNQLPHKLPPYRQKALVRSVDKVVPKKELTPETLVVPLKEFQNYPFGSTFNDVVHSECSIQIWGVDESRNPSFHGAYDHYILASASIADMEQAKELLTPIIESFGTTKFHTIYVQDVDASLEMVKDLTSLNPDIIYQPYLKEDQPPIAANYHSRQVMYTALRGIIRKIQKVSDADIIIVLVDSNDFLTWEDYGSLSIDNVFVRPKNDIRSTAIQIADIMAGVMGLYLRTKNRDDRAFNTIKDHVKGARPYREPQSRYGLNTTPDNNYDSKNIKPLPRKNFFRADDIKPPKLRKKRKIGLKKC